MKELSPRHRQFCSNEPKVPASGREQLGVTPWIKLHASRQDMQEYEQPTLGPALKNELGTVESQN